MSRTHPAGRSHEFRFVDRWSLPLPPDDVYDLLARPRHYPLWWQRGVHACPAFDPGEPEVGRRVTLVVRGFLPYRITMVSEAVALERPHRIVADASGDLVGRGEWRIRAAGRETEAEFDWRVEVAKPLERRIAPYLKPLIEANHAWTMRRGEEGIVRHGPSLLAALRGR